MSNKYLIVEARFYEDISDYLLDGAITILKKYNLDYDKITVPGALEIPAAIAFANSKNTDYTGYIALGCVIRGETSHYDIVANQSAAGIMDLTINDSLAIGNGIITVENIDQAMARARKDMKNKGGGAAMACINMVELKQKFLNK